MFCEKCGKQLEESWKGCPYCGADIRPVQVEQSTQSQKILEEIVLEEVIIEEVIIEEVECVKSENIDSKDIETEDIESEDIETQDIETQDIETQDIETQDIESEYIKPEDIEVVDSQVEEQEQKLEDVLEIQVQIEKELALREVRKKGEWAIRIVSIIAIICFFVPLCAVSCGEMTVLEVSGKDYAFGITLYGEKMEGNLFYGLLLLFPIYTALYSVVWIQLYENKLIKSDWKTLGEEIAGVGVALLGTCVVLGMQITRARESLNPEIFTVEATFAVPIIWFCGLTLVAIGTWRGGLERAVNAGKSEIQSWIIIFIRSLIGGGVLVTICFKLAIGDSYDKEIPQLDSVSQYEEYFDFDESDIDWSQIPNWQQ